MATKPTRALLTVLTLSVILTVLYAGDKGKPAQVSKLNIEAFSANELVTTKADLVYKVNTDPIYAHLSPSEKVKEIARLLRNQKGFSMTERSAVKGPQHEVRPSAKAKLK